MIDKDKLPILLADDDSNARALLASILKSCGYHRFEHAADGQQAFELLRREVDQIGLAFLDIDMPGYSGIEVMQLAKSVRPGCACVIVSAHSMVDNVLAALKAGACGFVVKPYSASRIVDVLAKFEREATA